MAKKKSIEELYKSIFSIREALQDAVSIATDTANLSKEFGGTISRVITQQINEYFIPAVVKYVEDPETPGAIAPLITFLDSVPLAMTREEPQPEFVIPSPVDTNKPQSIQEPPVLEGAAIAEEPPVEEETITESKKVKSKRVLEKLLKKFLEENPEYDEDDIEDLSDTLEADENEIKVMLFDLQNKEEEE